MTSKRSWNSIRLLKGELGRNLWMNALFAIGLFFSMPVVTVMLIQDIQESLKSGRYTSQDVKDQIFGFLTENPFVTAIVIVGALVAGLTVFSYLHHRARTDLYHALPIRRQGIFFAQYSAGVLAFLAPYLVFQGLSLLILAASGFGGMINYGGLACTMGITVLFYLMIYSTAVLAANLCGNLVVSILGAGVLCGILPALWALFGFYASTCFETLYVQDLMSNHLLMRLSPVSFYLEAINGGMNGLDLLGAVGVTLLLALAALFLHRDRASEAAGHAIAFRWAQPVIKYPLVLAMTLSGGLIFGWAKDGVLSWRIFGFACGLLLSHVVLEAIFYSDLRAWKKGLPGLGIFVLAFTAVSVMMGLDVIGYDSFVPEENQVVSVQMNPGSLTDRLPLPMDQHSGQWLSYEDPDTIRAALELAENGVQCLDMDEAELSEMAEKEEVWWTSFVIRYTLRSGQQVSREYRCLDVDRAEKTLEKLFENETYWKKTYPILTGENLQELLVYPESVFEQGEVRQDRAVRDPEKLEKLAQAYWSDWKKCTWTGMEEELVVGQLNVFSTEKEYSLIELVNGLWRWQGESPREYYQMPVYASFTETIRVLESLTGYRMPVTLEPSQVQEIQIYYYKEIDGADTIEQMGKRIDTPEEIREELQRLTLQAEDSPDGMQDNYRVEIFLQNGNYLTARYREGALPAWLRNATGQN